MTATATATALVRIDAATQLGVALPRDLEQPAGIGVGPLRDGVYITVTDAHSARRLAAAATQCADAFDRLVHDRTLARADRLDDLARSLRADGDTAQAAEYEAVAAQLRQAGQ